MFWDTLTRSYIALGPGSVFVFCSPLHVFTAVPSNTRK